MLLFEFSLAWRNLTYNFKQFIVSIIAVSFAVVLMLTQIAFREGMIESNVAFLKKLDADIILVDSERNFTSLERTFDKYRLYQAKSLTEIISAEPLYLTLATWKNFSNNTERIIRVFAFDIEEPVFLFQNIQNYLPNLSHENTVLADTASRNVYGPLTIGTQTELSGQRIKVVGNFQLGSDFVADGNILMSDENFLRIFGSRPSGFSGDFRKTLNNVDLGLIKVQDQSSIEQVISNLKRILPKDVAIFTKLNYVEREKNFYSEVTLGFIFKFGAITGFFIGIFITYNIVSADIRKNMPQYATLKAIGHSQKFLLNVVLFQVILIAILGFIPGLCLSQMLCDFISQITGLLIPITYQSMRLIFFANISMCLTAGVFSAQKLNSIDPVDIYSRKF
ncbi:hypothetical protein AWQ22_06825 [Picosynechococcus sp. PCC 7117]|nr:hypothetical protein AWQ22_06825 [Picosynechococcus sp. PCC 7117]